MPTTDEMFSELLEAKNSIQNNNFNIERDKKLFEKVNSYLISSATGNASLYNVNMKSNIFKSFMVTFNVSNFSDLTVLFITSKNTTRILEYAGREELYDEFKKLLDSSINFYKDLDKIKFRGSSFRIFHESMENANGIYTILTVTESIFFKPSQFHILCDILMDITRSTDISTESVFNDLFEDTIIGINSYLAANRINDSEFYLFKFENIYDFFLKMGLEVIIELSDIINKKLIEVFGDRSSIFRFSLSEYIVIQKGNITSDSGFSDLNKCDVIDFNYKGILLQHRFIKIPYKNDQSIYDVFENIFLINDTSK